MKLYPHQKKFLDDNPNNALLCFETGTGKTFVAKVWLQHNARGTTPVVVCPKQIKKDWEDTTGAHVYSFEEFKKAAANHELPDNPSAIIVDEADCMASPLFVAKQRSQRTEDLYHYIFGNPEAHVLLLTATPVRSTPWNMHTLLVLSRMVSPKTWKKYRESFFSLEVRPYLPRPAWLPKRGWQKRMQKLIDKYAYVALMADIVDLPPERHEVIKLKEPNYEENEEWEPMAQFVADHRLEQRTKNRTITDLSRGHRKVVVVAHYREQIDDLQKKLCKERETFVLDGRTKDAQRVVADAEASSECYFIVQASVSAGFELPSFAVMIFASMSYSVRDHIQTKGRIKRINAIKPVIYYYLLGGRCDTAIYRNIQAGKDFIPSEYMQA